MKTNLLNNLRKAIDDNLPTVLTGTGVVIGVTTVVYSIFAGWKIKEVVEDEKLEKKDKIKKTVVISAPVLIGTVASTACVVGAHKEHAKRYLALSGLYAASRLDAEKLKEKAVEIIGEDKVNEIKKEVMKDNIKSDVRSSSENLNVQVGDEIIIHDLVTGYVFKTTLNKFWTMVHEINDLAETESVPMATFYERLLGKEEYRHAASYDDIGFGNGEDVGSFRPRLDSELTSDMKNIYTIEYPYSNLQ